MFLIGIIGETAGCLWRHQQGLRFQVGVQKPCLFLPRRKPIHLWKVRHPKIKSPNLIDLKFRPFEIFWLYVVLSNSLLLLLRFTKAKHRRAIGQNDKKTKRFQMTQASSLQQVTLWHESILDILVRFWHNVLYHNFTMRREVGERSQTKFTRRGGWVVQICWLIR